jgi:hypothetical protein
MSRELLERSRFPARDAVPDCGPKSGVGLALYLAHLGELHSPFQEHGERSSSLDGRQLLPISDQQEASLLAIGRAYERPRLLGAHHG